MKHWEQATDYSPENDPELATLENADEVDVDVGPLLTPSEIRNAEVLERFAPGTWIWGDLEDQLELRHVPKSLERVAISRSREIAREQSEDGDRGG